MDGKNKIGEVRGVGEHQNLEGCMTSIAEKKLNEFLDKDKYLKKVNDMKMLTEIDNKVNKNLELTKEELIFLYQIYSNIEGFGYEEDPRIEEIQDKRDIKKDFALIFNCKEENVGTKISDLKKNNVMWFYGDLIYYGEMLTDKFKKLQIIVGDAYFPNLVSAEGFENLQYICGKAIFPKLKSAKGFRNLKNISKIAYFDSLVSAEGFDSLENLNYEVDFPKLMSAEGFESLQSIGGSAIFTNLISAKGFDNLKNIRGKAYFPKLSSALGFYSLQNIEKEAKFPGLVSAEGFESLEKVNGEDAIKFKEEINSRGSKTL